MRQFYLGCTGLLLIGCGSRGLGVASQGPSLDGGVADAARPVDLSPPPPLDMRPAAPYPAPHAAYPQVENQGGQVLKSPKFVIITFDGDPLREDIEKFAQGIGATAYWKAVTAEYGVGPATVAGTVHVATAAPKTIDGTELEQWLTDNVTAPAQGWPAADVDVVYAVFYPDGTTVNETDSAGRIVGTSCMDFGGYHSEFALPSMQVPYVLVPRCQGRGYGQGSFHSTLAGSHEFVEVATDPLPFTNPAFAQLDANHLLWVYLIGGGEVSDMCAQDPAAAYRPDDLPYMIQRSWSNAAALAGQDPCVPATPGVYFNATVTAEDVKVQGLATQAIRVPVGKDRTIDVNLFSTAPLDAWSVSVDTMDPALSASLDVDTGQNGDVLKLTISSRSRLAHGAGAIYLTSRSNDAEHYWPVMVVQ